MFFVDHCHPFGAASASSNAGQICRAIIDVWRAETGKDGDVLGYEDDLANFRYPNIDGPFSCGAYKYRFDRDTSLALIDGINAPWHPTKTGKTYGDTIVFLGLLWDLVERRVSLTEPKRIKYLALVSSFLARADRSESFSLLELQTLHGTLVHVCFIHESGSSHLPVFSNLMAHYKGNISALRHLSSSARHTLRWWKHRLADPDVFRQLRRIGPLRDEHIFVDASTSWGLGFVIGRKWYSLKLKDGWKEPGRDICWLEAIALEILYLFLVQLDFRDVHLLVHSDNKAAIGALSKSRSPNLHLNLCARRAFATTSFYSIVPKLAYVESKLNPADRPSRGLPSFPLDKRLTRRFELPPDLAELFVDGDC